MKEDEYKTITNVGEGTYSEKRSKFLAFSHHVETLDEVKTAMGINYFRGNSLEK